MGFPISSRFFTRRLKLQRQVTTQDASGASRRAWEDDPDFIDVEAAIQPLSTAERTGHGQRLLAVTHEMFVRQNPAFRRGARFKDDLNRTFIVRGVRDEASFGQLWVIEARELLD